jgi:hypothetical protein
MKRIFQLVAGSALLFTVFFLTGCKTTDSADSGQLASVEISGHSEVEILRAMQTVFETEGYEHMSGMIYDKKGSSWDAAAYGGWSLGAVYVRLKLTVDLTPTGGYVVGCDAYMVNGRNQGVLEEERKMYVSERSECKRLLDEIKTRVNAPAAVNSP